MLIGSDTWLHSAAERRAASVLAAGAAGPSAVAIGIEDERVGSRDCVVLARGHARLLDDDGHPTTPTSVSAVPVFDVGSVTKVVVTASLCMHLVGAGSLALDDPVGRWFADFRSGEKRPVTVRDLLEHRAGLWEWWPTYLEATTQTDAVSLVQRLPLRYPPRSGRRYSDLGFMLLGEIVAREYGAALDNVAGRELFTPLGMTDSGYRPPGTAPDEAVVATSWGDWYERRMVTTGSPYPVPVDAETHTGWRDHVLVGEANDGNCWHAFAGVAGHAGLFTTAPDLLRWGRALLSSLDGKGPWRAAVVDEFFRPGADAGQGLGFRVSPDGIVGHPGFPGAQVGVLPGRGRVVVLLTNRLHARGEPPSLTTEWSELVRAVEV